MKCNRHDWSIMDSPPPTWAMIIGPPWYAKSWFSFIKFTILVTKPSIATWTQGTREAPTTTIDQWYVKQIRRHIWKWPLFDFCFMSTLKIISIISADQRAHAWKGTIINFNIYQVDITLTYRCSNLIWTLKFQAIALKLYFQLEENFSGDTKQCRGTLYLERFIIGTKHNSRNLFQPIRKPPAINYMRYHC